MLSLYGKRFSSRLLIGSSLYPSPAIMQDAIRQSGAEIVTVSLRRESSTEKSGQAFWRLLQELNLTILPNTAGCMSVAEAVMTAKMARDLFETNWVKLEVIGNADTLQPDVFGLVEAAETLTRDGFNVFPYCTDDLTVATRLVEAGCEVLMPWGAPIGTGKGLMNPYALATLRAHFPTLPLIIDAGLGKPSHACQAMELGYDAILLNTAIAKAEDPVTMARGFRAALDGGRLGYEAGTMPERNMAAPSTPVIGTPFWHEA